MADTLKFKCPKCHYTIKAELKKFCDFILYRCPKCNRNVVYYNNKFDIISDKMVAKLRKNKKLKLVSWASYPVHKSKSEDITKDKIVDLKILMETEKDFNSFLAKI